ncbi:MAG TPA: DNA/RNA nuclease SfsA [Deltaproteobacteria bacterium]|nr:DNA/RNA nuclease SfsA [Deltaproteobacteria bacterium]HQI80381.1 DNA/RNA nuclease SfsA [Deltaproteobacteria bacterium]
MDAPLISWPPLTAGTLLRRYKRFMADVRLPDGTIVTAHCPNSGRMLTCSEPLRPVYLSTSRSPGRKFPYTWEMIHMPQTLVVVNTLQANRIARRAIEEGLIPELSGYPRVSPEVRVTDRSRIDLLLDGPGKRPCLVEVKSSTMVVDSRAMFPDAVTARGSKHARELQHLCRKGNRAVMLFLIQRMDATVFTTAGHIDGAYAAALRQAREAGVEVLAYDTIITLSGVSLGRNIPCMV